MFGRETLFLLSFLLFTVFTLAAGFASSSITLLVLNGFAGLCSAAAVPPAQGMLSLAYAQPSKRKNAAFAAFSAGNPLGFIVGIISSGVASAVFSWRASFWFVAIVYALFTALAWWTLPREHAALQSGRERLSLRALRRFDVPGALLTVAGLGLLSAALTLAGDAPQGWRTPYVLVCLVLGIVLMLVFLVWENFVEEPLLPMGGIWRERNFSLTLAILLMGNLAFPTSSFWISLYMQRVREFNPLEVAVHLLPMAIMGTLVNVIAAMILHRVSNKLLMGIGAAAYMLSSTLYGLNRADMSYWAFIFPALCLNVIGADLEFNVTNVSVAPIGFHLLLWYIADINRCTFSHLSHPTSSRWLVASFKRRRSLW
jgi:predicted MFS family arabinose efflux permease